MSREIKVALYGGIALKRESVELVNSLVRAFLLDLDVVLVSGGIYDPEGVKTSVDQAAYAAASAYVKDVGQQLEQRFQTWLPEIKRAGIERKDWGKARILRGSPRSRRFQLVQGVDALVTIEGVGQTATVLELAMALGRTALPIGYTGSDSAAFWSSDRTFFEEALEIKPELATRLDKAPKSDADLNRLAHDIVTTILKKTKRRCLILMDFEDSAHLHFFEQTVAPAAISAGFAVHKLDEQEYAGDILQLFLSCLQNSHAIIADLTDFNPNVLYELGRIHQYGKIQPLILIRAGAETQLPFYISKSLVHLVGNDKERASNTIAAYLQEARRLA